MRCSEDGLCGSNTHGPTDELINLMTKANSGGGPTNTKATRKPQQGFPMAMTLTSQTKAPQMKVRIVPRHTLKKQNTHNPCIARNALF